MEFYHSVLSTDDNTKMKDIILLVEILVLL